MSYYIFDINNNLIHKNHSKNRNLPPLCIYSTSEHMYIITDKDLIESIKNSRDNNVQKLKLPSEKEIKNNNNYIYDTCLETIYDIIEKDLSKIPSYKIKQYAKNEKILKCLNDTYEQCEFCNTNLNKKNTRFSLIIEDEGLQKNNIQLICKDCDNKKNVYVLNKDNLQDIFHEMWNRFNILFDNKIKIKCDSNNIGICNINITKNISLQTNNLLDKNLTLEQNLKYIDNIKKMCNNIGLQFCNQKISNISSQLASIYFDNNNTNNLKTKFIFSSMNEKNLFKSIATKTDYICYNCQNEYENLEKCNIDFIEKLDEGGKCEIDNLKLICEDCYNEEYLNYSKNKYISNYNNFVRTNVIDHNYFKAWAFVFLNKKLKTELKNKKLKKENLELVSIDKNKAYKSALINSKYDFPVYSCIDTVNKFNGVLRTGFFYKIK